MRFLTTVAIIALLNISAVANAEQEPDQFEKLAPHLSLLNELSERRRPNSFFPNEQSQTYGVQVDYVNVGRGNLTFLRRDLVTVGRIPIVAARVYDSTADDGGDFGPGWRFALAETIEATPSGDLRHIDESGSVETLLSTDGHRFTPEFATLTDLVGAQRRGKRIIVTLHSGWTKDFERVGGDVHRLVKVADRNGNELKLEYNNAQLARITGGNGRSIEIERNADGRVMRISDDQGRAVLYEYTGRRLSATIDLGGNRWRYQYNENGQLNNIIDPLSQEALVVRYNAEGRVIMANIRHRKNSFQYDGRTTTVINGRGLSTRFTQGNAGLTTKVINAEGTRTEVFLDERLLPTTLELNGALRNTFAYNGDARLTSMTSYLPDEIVERSYTFNWASGQIKSMSSSDGTSFEFRYDSKGRLKESRTERRTMRYKYDVKGDLREVKVNNEVAHKYEYNSDGQIGRFTDGGIGATFHYDGVGRLKRVAMSDGESYQYEYNELGLRTLSNVGNTATAFFFDSASRLIGFATRRGGEIVTGYDYILGSDNLMQRADAHNGDSITVDYDGSGNPISYGAGDRRHLYSYDAVDRFIGVVPIHGDPIHQSYRPDEAGWRGRADTRTGVNLAPEQTSSAAYGSYNEIFFGRGRGVGLLPVTYEPSSATLQAIDNLGFVPPDSAQRAALTRSRVDSLDEEPSERAASFNRPSNSFFLPPELNQVNCFQMCSVWEVVVNVATSSPQVGEPVRFVSSGAADDACIMRNNWTWGDGTNGVSSGHISTIYKTYNTAGTKNGSVVAACTCQGLSARANWTVAVSTCNPGLQYTFHSSSFLDRPNWAQSRYLFNAQEAEIGGSFSFFLNVFSTNGSSADKTKFSDGVNMWNVSGSSCGSYSVTGRMAWRNQVAAQLLHSTAPTINDGGTCGTFTSSGSSGVLESITIALDCSRQKLTAAHEVGHLLGFSPYNTHSSDPTDIMYPGARSTMKVHPYHGRVLVEKYAK